MRTANERMPSAMRPGPGGNGSPHPAASGRRLQGGTHLQRCRRAIWQAFAAILPVRTVGVMGDGRTYDYAVALRAVTSVDGMTADYYPFTHDFPGETATRIINEVRGMNRVFYDCTSKPPGTIEME